MPKRNIITNRTCANCGKIGHLYRDCDEPTKSYGIIAYRYNANDRQMEFCMIQRRDSIAYIEFLRGRYNPINNIQYLGRLLQHMHSDERRRLINSSDLTHLWARMWITTCGGGKWFKQEFKKSCEKFSKMKERDTLNRFIKNCPSCIQHPEWGIPKGKRNVNETELDGAQREFCEESGYTIKDYKIHADENEMLPIFIEEYEGINHNRYQNCYFLAKMPNDIYDPIIHVSRSCQYGEVRDIRWMSIDDIRKHVRRPELQRVLNDVNKYIMNLYKKTNK